MRDADRAGARARGGQLLRAVGDVRPGRRRGVPRGPRRACTSRRTTSSSRWSIPADGRAAARRRRGRARVHDADQGGAAADPLPHRRHRRDHRSSRAPAAARSVRLTALRGRRDDMLIVRGVNLYPSQVEHVLLSVDGAAPHYRLIVERPGPTGRADARMRAGRRRHRRGRARRALARRAPRADGLVGSRSAVRARGTLPRSEGKAVRVVDRRAD